MAGILDEVMDGITANEKKESTTPNTPPTNGQTPPQTGNENTMHKYSDSFKEQYGEQSKKK